MKGWRSKRGWIMAEGGWDVAHITWWSIVRQSVTSHSACMLWAWNPGLSEMTSALISLAYTLHSHYMFPLYFNSLFPCFVINQLSFVLSHFLVILFPFIAVLSDITSYFITIGFLSYCVSIDVFSFILPLASCLPPVLLLWGLSIAQNSVSFSTYSIFNPIDVGLSFFPDGDSERSNSDRPRCELRDEEAETSRLLLYIELRFRGLAKEWWTNEKKKIHPCTRR
jgi:hypothetical protein